MTLDQFNPSYFAVVQQGDAFVARFVKPRLSEDENIEQMGQELLSLVEQYHCRQLVLSLEVVEFITSAALGKLITLHRRLHRKEGRLVLCHARGTVADVLKASRLHDYFTVAPSTDDALVLVACN
jgi:anti-sigma B factor antagonist